MHKDIKSHELGKMTANIESLIEGTSSCSPSQINPEWIGCGHSSNSLDQVFITYNQIVINKIEGVWNLPAAVFGGKYSYE